MVRIAFRRDRCDKVAAIFINGNNDSATFRPRWDGDVPASIYPQRDRNNSVTNNCEMTMYNIVHHMYNMWYNMYIKHVQHHIKRLVTAMETRNGSRMLPVLTRGTEYHVSNNKS